MKKYLLFTVLLFLTTFYIIGCSRKAETLQPAADPVLVERPALPAAIAVIKSQKMEYRSSPNGPPQDFGKAIALGDGVLAVGAPDMNSGEMGQNGSVFVYRKQGDRWVEETRLYASDQEEGSQSHLHFGAALAFSGDFLFVGAPAAGDPQMGAGSGAVYVFQDLPEGWVETARLAPENPQANGGFGSLLSAHKETLVVGQGYQGTQVHIFQHEGEAWNLQAQITLPVENEARAGLRSLALHGDTLAASLTNSIGEGELAQIFGHLLLYERSGKTWGEPVELSPAQSEYNLVGALDGDGEQATRLASSFTSPNQSGLNNAGIRIYERTASGWEQSALLTIPENGGPGISFSFGPTTIALDGDVLVAGLPGASEDSFWDGMAYVYQVYQGRWVDQLRLTHAEDGGFGDFFGSSIAVSGDTILVSAPNEFGNAVYVFEIGSRD